MKKIAYILILLTGFLYLSCFDETQDIPPDPKNPEISIRLSALKLSSGSTQTLGTTNVGSSSSYTFVIENVGKDYLYLTGTPIVEITGPEASMYSVTLQPADSLAPFTYKTFNVVFTPTGADGSKTAVVTIRSNDPNTGVFAVTLDGTAFNVVAPIINVLDPTLATVLSGGTTNVGTADVLSFQDFVFTIENNGTANLTFTPIVIGGIDASMFAVQVPPVSPIGFPLGTSTFTIRFTPASAGLKEGTITINNDDLTDNPYTFTILATGVTVPTPNIRVQQGSTFLPTISGSYNFGSVNQFQSGAVTTFTVYNTGTANLNLTGPVTISDAVNYTLTDTTTTPVLPAGSTSFTVVFNPQTTGIKNATVTIPSNDPDTASYTFAVTGTGVAIPEMDMFAPGPIVITSGGYNHNFGSTTIGNPVDVLFTIENNGSGSLDLLALSPRVDITGDAAFSVFGGDPAASVASGGSTTFWLRYNPTVLGASSATTITIPSNDANENPYTFTVQGSATATSLPEIEVRQGTNVIAIGNTYDIGGMSVGGTGTTAVFTIYNLGLANLNLTGVPDLVAISGADAAMFTVLPVPVTPINPAGTSNFTVTFNASSFGNKTATATILSNDTFRSPYTFTITGKGMDPEINVRQAATNVVSGGAAFDFGKVNTSSPKDYTFTIENLSAVDSLYLNGSPKIVRIAGSTDFTVLSQPSDTGILPLGSTTFVLRYTPTATGVVNAQFSISNNDAGENPYLVNVTGDGVNPLINVSEVAHNGTRPHLSQKVNDAGTPLTYTIQNTGTTALNLLNTPRVVVSGADASYFSVTQPAASIGAGGNSTFTITFNPVTIASVGFRSATVSIYSDAKNTPVYKFTVNGTATTPDIRVSNGPDIADGAGSFDFGSINYGSAGASSSGFTITNDAADATATLLLTGVPRVSISGADASSFTVTAQPGLGTIGALGTTAFTILFDPVAALPASVPEVRTALVTIINDDLDGEGTYTFTITGTCEDTQLPVINITSPLAGTPVNGTQSLVFNVVENLGVPVTQARIQGIGAWTAVTSGDLISSINGWGAAPNGAITIEMQSTDTKPNVGVATLTLTKDTVDPTITSVTSATANGSYRAGQTVNVTVNFSENVTLAGGNLVVTLDTGGTVTIAPFGPSNTASGTYTIAALQTSADLTAISPLTLSAGTLRDAAGNSAVLTIPGGQNIADLKNIIIDTTAPTITSVTSLTADGTYRAGQTVNVTVNFSENVTLAGGNLIVPLDSGGSVTIAPFGPSNTASGTYTIGAGQTSADLTANTPLTLSAGTLTDAAGNNTVLTTIPAGQNIADSKAIVIDTTAPTITSVTSITANGTYKLGDTVNVTVNFSENVTLAGGNLVVALDSGGTVTIAPFGPSNTASGTYTVAAGNTSADLTATSPLTLSAGTLVDAAGNNATLTIPAGQNIADLKAIVIDGILPTITSVTSTTLNGSYRAGQLVNVTVNFSENVTLAGGNLVVTLDTGGTVTIAPFGPSNTANGIYTVGAGETSADLNANTPLTLSAGTLVDAAGNNTVLTTIPAGQNIADLKAIEIDTTPPAITSVTSITANGSYRAGQTVNVTVNFSENVTLAGGNIVVTLDTGGTVTIAPFGPSNTASGTYTIGALETSADLNANTPLTLSAGTLVDAAGNSSGLIIPGGQNLADLKNIIIDTTAPAITSVTSITANGSYRAGQTVNVTVNFSENVTLAGGNLVVTLDTGGTVTIAPFGPSNTASGIYTVGALETSADLNANTPITLSAGTLVDAAGNSSGLAIPGGQNIADLKNIIIDTTDPTITSVTSITANGTYKLGDPVNVTVNFSENVTLAGGNLVVPLSSGGTVTIAPFGPSNTASGIYTVGAGDTSADLTANTPLTLSAGTLSDAAGNNTVLTTIPAGQNIADLKAIVIDGIVPAIVSVTSVTLDGSYRAGQMIDVTVTFTENVTLAGGNLVVTLDSGGTVTIAPFGPSNTASGIYTVGAGDTSADLSAVSPLVTGGTIVDSAGNSAVLTIPIGQNINNLKNIEIDTTSPVVAITAPIAAAAVNGTQVFTFTASDGTTQAQINGAAWANVTSGDLISTLSGWGAAGQGAITINFRSTDTAGNIGTTSVNVTKDTVAPIVAITAPIAAASVDGTEAFTFTASDGTTQAQIGGAAWVNVTSGDLINTLSGWGAAGLGPITINFHSTDTAGNVGTTNVNVTKI